MKRGRFYLSLVLKENKNTSRIKVEESDMKVGKVEEVQGRKT